MDVLGVVLVGVAGALLGGLAVLALRVGGSAGGRDGSAVSASAPATPQEPEAELDQVVLDALGTAVVLLGVDDAPIAANAAAAQLGLLRHGRLVHPEVQRVVADARRDELPVETDAELPRTDLRTRLAGAVPVHVRGTPLPGGRVLLVIDDHTVARQLESVRRDFVVNVSHELKTPVGALALLAETVEDAPDDPEAVRRFAGRMRVESQRLSALVQEIIELSRVQVSGSLADVSVVHVDALVGDAVDRARTGAAAKGIAIDVGGDDGARVLGDHDTLVTAVRNLIDNAVTYSAPDTRIALGVRVVEADRAPEGTGAEGAGPEGTAAEGAPAEGVPAGSVVEIAVVDQGIGISVADQPRVFERFYRVDPARSRDTGGTGLGLSIVKHIAAEHGGEVTVWSQEGKGSTFTLRLPAAYSSHPRRPAAQQSPQTTAVPSAVQQRAGNPSPLHEGDQP